MQRNYLRGDVLPQESLTSNYTSMAGASMLALHVVHLVAGEGLRPLSSPQLGTKFPQCKRAQALQRKRVACVFKRDYRESSATLEGGRHGGF